MFSMNKLMRIISDVPGVKIIKQRCSISLLAPVTQRPTLSMVENVLLIWLDNTIDEEQNEDWRNTINQFRCIINTIKPFMNIDQCTTFLSELDEEKVCMIISGSLGERIVPMIHATSQVDSIFIFCGNKVYHEQWAKKWPKIKGVFTEQTSIRENLEQMVEECEHNSFSISFMSASDDTSNKNMDHHDYFFIYAQLLKKILLSIQVQEQHIKEFIDVCRKMFANNGKQLKNVKQLAEKYRDKTPILWYTQESFLYSMLNRALRVIDLDIIFKMSFFIKDLHRQIKQLHSEQFGKDPKGQMLTVYRGQGLSKAEFQQLMNTKGSLMSFNSFLFTSIDREASFDFVRRAITNPDLTGVLFVMTVDTTKSTSPFALIKDVKCFQKLEDVILFSMDTVFRIHEIKKIDENNYLWQVELTQVSDDDQDLCALTKSMREETEESNEWFQLGQLLLAVDQPNKAQQLYELMLKQPHIESDKGNIFHYLGRALMAQGKYDEALTFYRNSLDIRLKTLPANHPELSKSYSNIGLVCYNMEDYSRALANYEKVLEINRKALPSGHPDMAKSYNNMGLVYDKMEDFSKALSYYEKSLIILKKNRPPDHLDLAASYNNIAGACDNMRDYPKALSVYAIALDIRQKALPSNHSDLAKSFANMGLIYNKMGDYAQALVHHEKALQIQQKALPPDHHDLAVFYFNIGEIYKKQGENSKARSYYEHAVEIGQTSLPAGHSDLKMYKKSLDSVKKK